MSNGYIDKAEVEAILSGGQPAVNKFVVESVITLKRGQEAQHELLEDAVVSGSDRERRLTLVEEWKKDNEINCAARIKKLIHDEHSVVHAAHMATEHIEDHPHRKDDANGEDHRDERTDQIAAVVGPIERKMWLLWGIFIFVVVEAGHALVMWAVERAAGN